jgi:hypothetical protein
MSDDREAAAGRLRLALDLFATGEAMMRQRLRREHPDLDAEELERRLLAWLRDRPGAPFGDAVGAPVTRPGLHP